MGMSLELTLKEGKAPQSPINFLIINLLVFPFLKKRKDKTDNWRKIKDFKSELPTTRKQNRKSVGKPKMREG